MPEKILLTGANGLLGSYILKDLLKSNYEVRAIHRKNSDLSLIEDVKDQVEWHEADMCDYLTMKNVMEGCDIVLHAAAIVSFDPKDKESMIDINVNGTRNLLDIAQELNIPYFLHISSIAAVGRPKGMLELDEDSKWEDNQNISIYARSKHLSEMEVWRANAEGLKTAIINPSFILGPGDWKKSSTQLLKYVWDENLFYSEGSLNFVDVRDVVKSIMACLEKKPNSERFIISSGAVPYRTLFDGLAERWNKRKPKFPVTKLIAELAWRLEALRSFLTGSKPFISKDSAATSRKKHVFLNDKSRNELNLQYRSLAETLDWLCPIMEEKYGQIKS